MVTDISGAVNRFSWLQSGELRIPVSVLKKFGPLAQTLAALWSIHIKRGRGLEFPASNDELSSAGCIELPELETQLAKLRKGRAIRVERATTPWYQLKQNVYKEFKTATEVVIIPRRWFHDYPNSSFSELAEKAGITPAQPHPLNSSNIYHAPEWMELFGSFAEITAAFIAERVSTTSQTGNYSAFIQKDEALKFAKAAFGFDAIRHDLYAGESGRTSHQQTLHRQLRLAREHGRAVVIRWSLPRILRPTLPDSTRLHSADLAELSSYGVPILSLMPLDCTDVELNAAMNRLIRQYKLEHGEKAGSEPWFNLKTVRLIRTLRRDLSYRKIAEYLTANQIPAPRNGKWHARTVNRLIQYYGELPDELLKLKFMQQGVTDPLNMTPLTR